MQTIDTDVLVVGAGPTGLAMSALLASYGVSALSIARHPGTAHTPRAHVTNQRTLEVFRDLGIEERVREAGWGLDFLSHNIFATAMAGTELARYRSYGTSADRMGDYALASPGPGINCPQNVMEPVLLAAAREMGADIRFSNELLDFEQTQDGVRARILDRDAGAEYVVRARYLVGADGARSRVAEQVGIEFEGQSDLRSMRNIWVEADLSKYTAHRPGVLYSIFQPGNLNGGPSGTWACMRPWDQWIFMSAAAPDAPEEVLLEKARATLGDPDIEIKVKTVIGWQVNHMVAKTYRKGRVFLAGDAAHRHPPSGGLGSNTSIQDAFNLAWKLSLVLSGKAGPGLLDSYEAERRPVGKQVVDRAMKGLVNTMPLVPALGLHDGQSKEDGWAALDVVFSDSEEGRKRRAALKASLQLQNYRSNALGVELGQRYRSEVIVDDGTPFPEPDGDPELYYRPTTHPGGYLPHGWVEHDRRRVSTLDLVGKGRFSLLVGVGGEAWTQAAAEISAMQGIDLRVCSIGFRCEFDDVVGDWEAVREIGDGGALLVRPDRFIAWRCQSLPRSPKNALLDAVRKALSLDA